MHLSVRVQVIPGERGFWHTSTESEFQKAAIKLKGMGMKDDDIMELLSNLYLAVADEYSE